MIKNVVVISIMFLIGFREEISVFIIILRLGVLFIILKKNIGKKEKVFYGNFFELFILLLRMNLINYGGVDIEFLCIYLLIYKFIVVRLIV